MTILNAHNATLAFIWIQLRKHAHHVLVVAMFVPKLNHYNVLIVLVGIMPVKINYLVQPVQLETVIIVILFQQHYVMFVNLHFMAMEQVHVQRVQLLTAMSVILHLAFAIDVLKDILRMAKEVVNAQLLIVIPVLLALQLNVIHVLLVIILFLQEIFVHHA